MSPQKKKMSANPTHNKTFWRVIKTGEKKILPRLKNGRKRY